MLKPYNTKLTAIRGSAPGSLLHHGDINDMPEDWEELTEGEIIKVGDQFPGVIGAGLAFLGNQ